MRVCVIAVTASLWFPTLAAAQPSAALELPEAWRARVKNDRFGIVTSVRGLPLGVREELQMLFGSMTLDIDEPGADVRAGVVDPNSPRRRLAAAGCSMNYCIVYYERVGTARTWQVALFHWTPAMTRFEWGGMAPRGLKSIDDVRKALLSGTIKGPVTSW